MSNKIQNELILLGKFISGIVAIVVSIWFFGRAPFNEKVDGRISKYISGANFKVKVDSMIGAFLLSAQFKVMVDQVIEDYEKELAIKKSNKIPLRKLLSIKMKCDEDEVHIRLGRLVVDEEALIKDISRLKRKLQAEIKKYHSNSNLNIE